MGSLKLTYWAFLYVLIGTLSEIFGFYFFSEKSDASFIVTLFILFIFGLLIEYKKINRISILYIFIGFSVVAILSFIFKLDFYYHDYPEKIMDFLPNIIFKPIILLIPFFVSMVAMRLYINSNLMTFKNK